MSHDTEKDELKPCPFCGSNPGFERIERDAFRKSRDMHALNAVELMRQRDEQDANGGWISVRERMPDYGVPVLVVYAGVTQNVLYFLDIGEWRSANDENSDHMPQGFVTHWQPRPIPPRAAHRRRDEI